jgi:hypothetical protein
VRLPVHLPAHFTSLDALCGGGKRKMPSSFPGSFSRADVRAVSHGQIYGQLLTGTFDTKIPVLTRRWLLCKACGLYGILLCENSINFYFIFWV